jgi:signal transduction histidine kinase
MPLWFGIHEIGLSEIIDRLRNDPNGNTLMLGAFFLVMLNTVRALPHYIGALLLGDELSRKFKKNFLKVLIPLTIIPLVYMIINLYSPLSYHFGGPALLLLASIVLLHLLGKGRVRPVLKAVVFMQLLFGIQWLDTVTFLTAYDFGGGPLSTELKSIAISLDGGVTLSLYSLTLCGVFVINATILVVYLMVSEQKWRMSLDLSIAHHEMTDSRSEREALHLVHDLKTPLALIEGLNSLIHLKTANNEIKEYSTNISKSIESTSEMISEILYVDTKNWYTLKEVIEYVRANKVDNLRKSYLFQLEADTSIQLYVNKIRLTRAMVNLIDNAADAVFENTEGRVAIIAKLVQHELWLGVQDNGIGIPRSKMAKIYRPGYSTKSHPGVGLTFVKTVADSHQATLDIETEYGYGTTFWLKFPQEVLRYEDIDH